MVSSVIDLLLRTLFNIEGATVVTLYQLKVTLLFLQCIHNCIIMVSDLPQEPQTGSIQVVLVTEGEYGWLGNTG